MANVSRSRKSYAIVLIVWLLGAGVSAVLLKDRLLAIGVSLFAWIVGVIGLLYLISAIANRVNERHDEWLRAHGLAVQARVAACFVKGTVEQYEAATFTVIATGVHPVTREQIQFRFFTNHPLWYRSGTIIQLKVNPRKTSDYMCESAGAL